MCRCPCLLRVMFFFLNDTATTEIYTLSLHAALPISLKNVIAIATGGIDGFGLGHNARAAVIDRKSTRLNSSHQEISYAGFCLKKKMKKIVVEVSIAGRRFDETVARTPNKS